MLEYVVAGAIMVVVWIFDETHYLIDESDESDAV
jgi:hypothetical protein